MLFKKRLYVFVLLAIFALVTCRAQMAMAGEWAHYTFTDIDNFGFRNERTGQVVIYGTREYGQLTRSYLPRSYQGIHGGQVYYQNGLYYFSVPGRPDLELVWHAGMDRWISATSR